MTMQSITQSQGDGRQQPAYDSRSPCMQRKKGLICTEYRPSHRLCTYITTGSSPIASHQTKTTIPPTIKPPKEKKTGSPLPNIEHEHIRSPTHTSQRPFSSKTFWNLGDLHTHYLSAPWRRYRPPNKKASDGGPALPVDLDLGVRDAFPLVDQGSPRSKLAYSAGKNTCIIYSHHSHHAYAVSPSCLPAAWPHHRTPPF